MNGDLTAAGIKKSLNRLALATVGVYVAVLGIGGYAWYSAEANTKKEVCKAIEVIKDINADNLRQDIADSRKFMADNPGPEPIPGIPRELFEQGIQKNEDRLATLGAIKC